MIFRLGMMAIVFCVLVAGKAMAFSVEYDPQRPAELGACDALLYIGHDAEANACYADLLRANQDERILAEASRALGDLKTANEDFRVALKKYPDDPRVRTRWGWLFLDTHQPQEAVKLFLESLDLNADFVPAKLGLATVAAQRFEGKARQWVKEVLDAQPDNVEALLIRGRMDLEEGNLDTAGASLKQALDIVQRRHLPPVEVYALLSAHDLLTSDLQNVGQSAAQTSPWVAKALAYNPRYGQIYETEAYYYVITRRYRQAIDLLKQAVELQPGLASAHASLGVNLLRENRVDEAQRQLMLAYSSDPYDPVTVNTLRLIDSFANFVVSRDAPPDGEAGPVIITRLHKDEVAVLEPYVVDLTRKAIATYSDLFGFVLKDPVVVELYPDPDDFAVRVAGLPGIGLLGVTFGYLVAMDSPSGRKPGEFHWGTTLWHEMAHVFTLEMTNHLVPRWFSEGVSVYEEWTTGPLAGRHLPPPFFEAMKDHKLLPVAHLDQGFIRPEYRDQIIVSYMQAGMICEYIHGKWGQQGLRDMLTAYTDGLDTAAAVQRALGISATAFDVEFTAYLQGQFGTTVANLDAWKKALQAAHEAAAKADWPAAQQRARTAIELFPDYVDDGSPWLVLAHAAAKLDQHDAQLDALEEYRRRGGYDPAALRKLAEMLHEQGNVTEAISALEAVVLVAPFDASLHADLGDWLLAADQPTKALKEYQAYEAMKPHDQAAVHYRLARAYLDLGNKELGRKQLLDSLSIAPNYREAQKLLLEMVRGR